MKWNGCSKTPRSGNLSSPDDQGNHQCDDGDIMTWWTNQLSSMCSYYSNQPTNPFIIDDDDDDDGADDADVLPRPAAGTTNGRGFAEPGAQANRVGCGDPLLGWSSQSKIATESDTFWHASMKYPKHEISWHQFIPQSSPIQQAHNTYLRHKKTITGWIVHV